MVYARTHVPQCSYPNERLDVVKESIVVDRDFGTDILDAVLVHIGIETAKRRKALLEDFLTVETARQLPVHVEA